MEAALAGGYAHLCAMANTKPVVGTPRWWKKTCKRRNVCGFAADAGAAAGEGLGDETPTDARR